VSAASSLAIRGIFWIALPLLLIGGVGQLIFGAWESAVVPLSMAVGLVVFYWGGAPPQSAWSPRGIAGMALLWIAAVTSIVSVVSLLSR
jgi:hypothetical protein